MKTIFCPKCRAPNPTLIEDWENHTITFSWEGERYGEGNLEPGNARAVYGRCEDCKHHWKLRRLIQVPDWVIFNEN